MNRWRSLGVADQYGKRVVVTGANTGLGYQAALALAGAGAEVVLAVRDLDRGQAAAQRIRDRLDDAKLRVSYLDLADLASVRDFAAAQVVGRSARSVDQQRRSDADAAPGAHSGRLREPAGRQPSRSLRADRRSAAGAPAGAGRPGRVGDLAERAAGQAARSRAGADREIHADGGVQPVKTRRCAVRRGARPPAAPRRIRP